jgi:ribosomal protein S18 acetylase RimI-like enzyme
MNELTNEKGIVCACIDIMQEDSEAWAIVVSWKKGVDSLIARGFKQGESRVEYRMAINAALAALEAREIAAELAWSCVDTGSETNLARAATYFRQAAEGDPAAHRYDDTFGFLKTLLEKEETVKAPERVQIGTFEGIPAAVLALMVYPSDGWSTIYYLGVLPDFRGRGFGAEAMLHGVRCLRTMGGSIYHDGTASGNVAARALFARLGRPPFRSIEEWKLSV